MYSDVSDYQEKYPPEFHHDEEIVWAGFLIFQATGRMPTLEDIGRVEPTLRQDILTVVHQVRRQRAYFEDSYE